jgi:hypothetical protein
MAATDDIIRPRRPEPDSYGFPVLGGIQIFRGTMAGITAAGAAVPATHASCVALIGFAAERVDNRNGATGSQSINLKKGVYKITLAGATPADINKPVYASADDTFTLAAGALLQAGVLHAIDTDGIWLKTL